MYRSLRCAIRCYGEFPSLKINASGFSPNGTFAEAQAEYLRPDSESVSRLDTLLKSNNAGIVAHFYMDPELQGVLGGLEHPHVFTSDSLAMADAAVSMAEQGVKRIIVMGVDFMSENVRAVLDYKGHTDVGVFRLSEQEIGCTLAAGAEAPGYGAWLDKANKIGNGLHVVYINTSLVTKAKAHAKVPTITCTSSNVVRTIMQAFAQVPDITVWFGPDTHMGGNLRTYFTAMSKLSEEEIKKVHPAHDVETVKNIVNNLEVYPQGTCVVHEMFGADVVRKLKNNYADCYHTAHLEVPGEMFGLASQAKAKGLGQVGSTSDILHFITDKVDAALAKEGKQTVRVTLGTEAGMITPIAKKVQQTLQEANRSDIDLEIIFPVSSSSVTVDDNIGTGVVPGPPSGEGCSTAGGCATCVYMKMNSLDSLLGLLETMPRRTEESLAAYHPKVYNETIGEKSVAEVGGETILHMRAFQVCFL